MGDMKPDSIEGDPVEPRPQPLAEMVDVVVDQDVSGWGQSLAITTAGPDSAAGQVVKVTAVDPVLSAAVDHDGIMAEVSEGAALDRDIFTP